MPTKRKPTEPEIPKEVPDTPEPEDVGAEEAPSSSQPSPEKELSLTSIRYSCTRCGTGERLWKVLSAEEKPDDRIRVEMQCPGCKNKLPFEADRDEILGRAK